MEVKEQTLPAFFDSPVWNDLVAADPNRHVFAAPMWSRLWWEHFGEGQRPLVLTFHDPEPVGMAAFTIDITEQGRRLRFMGGDDLTDYQGPVIAGEAYRRPVAEAMLIYLRDSFEGWDYFEAKCMPVPFGFSEWLVEAADRFGMLFGLELHELTAVLGLPGGWEGYLRSLDRKKRHELERKMRRFDREAPGAVLRTSTAETLDSDIDEFIGLHRTSEGEKGEFFLPQRVEFFRDVARTAEPLGLLSLDFLELEGRPMATTFSFRYDNVLYLYNSAYDLELRPISPGLILVARLIQRSVDERLRRFDFLRGRERYKYDLGAEALPLHWVVIRRQATS